MASIRRQGKSWQAIVRRKGYPSKSKSFPKRALAARWASEMEALVSTINFTNYHALNTTVEALVARYGEEISPRKRGFEVERYRIATIIEYLGDITLDKLTPAVIVNFVDMRLEEVKPDSVRKEINLLSHAVDVGMALWGIQLPLNPVTVARNILKVTQTLGAGNKRDRRPTKEELKILYASHIGAVVEFAVETAMRRGEILNMEPKHREGNELEIPLTKTDEPRTIPLSKRACELFDTVVKWNENGHTLSQAFRRICEANHITDLRFHDLRHEAASRFFEKGLDIAEVAKITGQTYATLQTYTHLKASNIATKLD